MWNIIFYNGFVHCQHQCSKIPERENKQVPAKVFWKGPFWTVYTKWLDSDDVTKTMDKPVSNTLSSLQSGCVKTQIAKLSMKWVHFWSVRIQFVGLFCFFPPPPPVEAVATATCIHWIRLLKVRTVHTIHKSQVLSKKLTALWSYEIHTSATMTINDFSLSLSLSFAEAS